MQNIKQKNRDNYDACVKWVFCGIISTREDLWDTIKLLKTV